jgi:SAM-dependent methyltransferase
LRLLQVFRQLALAVTSGSSTDYWRRRYRSGLDSGAGSYGQLANFKAQILNDFVSSNNVRSVLELGCGDGNQLALANYPSYVGLDVSGEAIDLCMRRFTGDSTKAFLWFDPARTLRMESRLSADLVLSLDVIYHLLEDEVYDRYLDLLFACSHRWTIIYSSNRPARDGAWHVRNREFTGDVATRFPDFELVRVIENPHRDLTPADFYIYRRMTNGGSVRAGPPHTVPEVADAVVRPDPSITPSVARPGGRLTRNAAAWARSYLPLGIGPGEGGCGDRPTARRCLSQNENCAVDTPQARR